jgi:hypothetical protein
MKLEAATRLKADANPDDLEFFVQEIESHCKNIRKALAKNPVNANFVKTKFNEIQGLAKTGEHGLK